MNRRTILTLSAIATFGLATLSLGQLAYADDPTVAGTWDLNIAKSTSTDPMPKSVTRTYEVTATSEKLTGAIVTADDKTIPISFTATVDGKDSPFQSPGADTVAITRVDAWTTSYVTKLAGKEMVAGSRILSKDGKVLTFTQKGVNAAGKAVESTMVYDRR
jgi:hypothetical protein